MILAALHLGRHPTRQQAYLMLQLQLMRCYIRRGGNAVTWCTRYAAVFRRRFDWMLAADA